MESHSRLLLVERYLEQEENIRVSDRLWREYQIGRDLLLAGVDDPESDVAVLTRFTAAYAFVGALSIEQKNPALRSKIFALFTSNLALAGVGLENAVMAYQELEAKFQEHLEIFKMQVAMKNSGCVSMLLLGVLAWAVFLVANLADYINVDDMRILCKR
jgi:hypothetical protein